MQKAFYEAVRAARAREDLKKYAVECKTPVDCTEAVLDRFAMIVTEAGEVVDNIRNRIESACVLGYVTYEGIVVGTSALTKPKPSHRTKVFENAKSAAKPNNYPFQLDWIFLQTEHRKKGQMTKLLEKLIPQAKKRNMFATANRGNELMREVLLQANFQANGDEYPSPQQPDQTLQLFIRQG